MTIQVPTTVGAVIAADPLLVPPGVERWLREVESDSTALHREASERLHDPNALELLVDVARRLTRFLSESEPASLPGILSRSLADLAIGSPTQRLFKSLADCLITEGRLAVALQVDVDAIAAAVSELTRDFLHAPNLAARLLAEASLTPSHLIAIRSPAEVAGARRRIEWVRVQLIDLTVRSDALASTPIDQSLGTPIDEIIAAYKQRIRLRRAISWRLSGWRRVRQQMFLHYEALREIGAAVHLHTTEAYILDELIRPAIHSDASVQRDDPFLHGAMLGLASKAYCQALVGGKLADRDPSRMSPRPSYDGWPSVIAVGGELVILTTSAESSVRVPGDTVLVAGAAVAPRLLPAEGWELTELANLDVAPLFNGVAPGMTGTFKTVADPILRIVGDSPVGTIARIERRGAVERVPAPTERLEPPAAFRLLRLPDPNRDVDRNEITSEGQALPPFLGFRTERVHTRFVGCEAAWLRTADNPSVARSLALSREAQLLEAIGRSVDGAVAGRQHPSAAGPPPVVIGHISDDKRPVGFLYVPPLAVNLSANSMMNVWLMRSREGRLAAVQAVARLRQAVRRAGFVAGTFHVDAIGFGAMWSNEGPRPTATLFYAPLATPLGSAFPSPPRRAVENVVYGKLGFRGLTPGADDIAPATFLVDDVAFAVAALEILAERPLSPGTDASWNRLLDAVTASPEDQWMMPRVAKRLAEGLVAATIPNAQGAVSGQVLESVIGPLAAVRSPGGAKP